MQSMDFWFFWDIFRKKWKVILFCAFALATISGVVSKVLIKPVYRSSVSLYLGRGTESSSLEKVAAMSRGQGGELTNTAAELALGNTLGGDYRELINFDVITEGVENWDQVDFLKGVDIKYVQGYLFDRPMTREDFEQRLANRQYDGDSE